MHSHVNRRLIKIPLWPIVAANYILSPFSFIPFISCPFFLFCSFVYDENDKFSLHICIYICSCMFLEQKFFRHANPYSIAFVCDNIHERRMSHTSECQRYGIAKVVIVVVRLFGYSKIFITRQKVFCQRHNTIWTFRWASPKKKKQRKQRKAKTKFIDCQRNEQGSTL